MDDRLARYSWERLRQLNVRSTPDAIEEQITLKIPISTGRQARQRGEFLIAPKLPLQQRGGPVGGEQERLQGLPSAESGLQEQVSSPLSPESVRWDKISTPLMV